MLQNCYCECDQVGVKHAANIHRLSNYTGIPLLDPQVCSCTQGIADVHSLHIFACTVSVYVYIRTLG